VSVAIATLLTDCQFSNWVLNNTVTLNDVTVTVDLRNKESLWAQIMEVCATSRNATFVRYGGYSGGNYLLDIGYFRQRVNVPKAVWKSNILTPPRFQESNDIPIKIIYPVSGASADVPISLDDALAIDPTLNDASQDYQILTGQGAIRNNTITRGIATRREYQSVKTKNDTSPSQAELNETALSLYRVAAQDLEASQSSTSLSVKITSDSVPQIHDAIWFEGKIFETGYDLLTEEFELIESFDLNGYMRIVGITADLRERYSVYNEFTEQFVGNAVYELELVQGDKRITKSAIDILLAKTENTSSYDNLQATVGGGVLGISTVTVQQTAVAANCTYSVGLDGRSFVFTLPSAPVGATSAIIVVKSVSPTNYVYLTTTYGTIGGIDHELCVQNSATSDWTILDDAIIIINIFWV